MRHCPAIKIVGHQRGFVRARAHVCVCVCVCGTCLAMGVSACHASSKVLFDMYPQEVFIRTSQKEIWGEGFILFGFDLFLKFGRIVASLNLFLNEELLDNPTC